MHHTLYGLAPLTLDTCAFNATTTDPRKRFGLVGPLHDHAIRWTKKSTRDMFVFKLLP